MRSIQELVTILTREHDEIVWDEGRMIRYREPALLAELADMRGSTITSPNPGAGAGGHGLPFDPDASKLWADIMDEFNRDYLRLVGRPLRRLHPAERVLLWAELFLADGPTAGEVAAWEKQLEEWVGIIRRMMKPKRTQLIDAACPVCGAWRGARDGEEFHALTMTFSEGDLDSVTLACRACLEVIASGEAEVRHAARTRLRITPAS
ncbi:hypothetical protein JRG19_02500 [Pseudoclavibacter alba]|uniref:hypothetical protein n=1 Tax=Pseudoclavibacter albus TaxID=272241 RepID=UPI0019D262AA|nr:hypothetical protein [Pseudoclavibacter alba]MBN6777421.1 hypothetical protein [Pseudoclavibacter alba]